MGKVDPVDAIGWSAILLWLALSGYFALSVDSAAFQAVGVVGIAAGVSYFAMQRHATPHAYGSLEIENILSDRIVLATDLGSRALAYTSILAKQRIDLGEALPPLLKALSQIDDEHNADVLARSVDDDVRRGKEILAVRLAANKAVERARRSSEVSQAVVVVTATLQSGLGSYLIEFFGK